MHPKRLESRILKAMNRAVADFDLIGPGDRILVALSGGKDSYGLHWGLEKLRAAAPFRFDLVLFHLDQGQPGHDPSALEAYMKASGLPWEIEYQDTYTKVLAMTEPGKIYCSACSRFRRAILYKAAGRHDCNKVALGHHRDDLIETILISMFFAGQMKSMPPRLRSQSGTHEVIRPLAYVPESEMIELSEQQSFPVIPCQLCGSQQGQRDFVKNLLTDLEKRSHHIKGNILNALGNIKPTHLLDKAINPLFAQREDAALPTDDDEADCASHSAPTSQLTVL